jgi:hypothetical protein
MYLLFVVRPIPDNPRPLILPPSDNLVSYFLQEIEDYAIGLRGLRRKITVGKILLTSWVVKEKIASPNCWHFLAKVKDFLKWGILGDDPIDKGAGGISHRKADYLL